MKKINLFIIATLMSFVSFSQNTYQVQVCGSDYSSAGGYTTTITIEYAYNNSTQTLDVITDSLGSFCETITILDSLGSMPFEVYIGLFQDSCGANNTINYLDSGTFYLTSLQWLEYFDYALCGSQNSGCNAEIYEDSTGVLSTYANGTAPFSYIWSDGSLTSYTYSTPNSNEYCVTITDANGCEAMDCYLINTSNCDVYLGTSSSTVWVTSNGANPSYLWSDGSTGYSMDISPNISEYCVTATATDGCVSTGCLTLYSDDCETYVTSDIDPINIGTVNFYTTSTGVAPFTYSWSFSDGTVSNLANPTHVFTQSSGWSWACVEVTDVNGCVASYCDYVEIVNPLGVLCMADFMANFDDISGVVGEVFFEDWSATNDSIVSWFWEFGDGNTSTLQNPSNIYTVADYYTVVLTVEDASGCVSSISQTCYIDPSWWTTNPWNNPNGVSCNADFIAYQDSLITGGLVYLVDLSFGQNLSYTWDFGNGTVITSPYPFVNFNSFGDFYVCLTVTDTINGCSDSFCDTLTVDSLGNLGKTINWGISVIPTPMPQTIANVVTGVKETVDFKTETNLFPNPASSDITLNIKVEKENDVIIQVVDITGKTVNTTNSNLNLGNNKINLNLSNLSDGMYFVKVNGNQINTTNKLVIKH